MSNSGPLFYLPYPSTQPPTVIKMTAENGNRPQLGSMNAHLNSQMAGLSINNHSGRVIPSTENNISRHGIGSSNNGVANETGGTRHVNLGNNVNMNGIGCSVGTNVFKNENNNSNGMGTGNEANYRAPKWGFPVAAIPGNIIHAQNSVLPINAVPASSSTQIPLCYIHPSLPPQATPASAPVGACLPSYPSNIRQDLNLMYQHSPGPKSNLVLVGSQMPSNPSNICSFQTLPIQASPTIQSIPQIKQNQSQANRICSTNIPQPPPPGCSNGIISPSPHYPYAINNISMPPTPSQIGNGASFTYRHQMQVSDQFFLLLINGYFKEFSSIKC